MYTLFIYYRLMILLCFFRFCQGQQKKIVINFNCSEGEIDFKCTTEDLIISETDKNAAIVMGSTAKSPQNLFIESSRLFFIPPQIFESFAGIKEFVARNVSLEEIHFDTFSHASKIRYLILSFNKIKMLIDKSFVNASKLQILKLQHNEIIDLSSHSFFGLTELRVLRLSFNKIINLPLYVFRDLESLEDLELDNNFIKVISANQFETNLELTTLNFEMNAISKIDYGTFANTTKLERLNLNGNICVDKNFGLWRVDNQIELDCCAKVFNEMKICSTKDQKEVNQISHIPLILLLFFSIIGNFFVILYLIVYKRRRNNPNAAENIELIASDMNGSAYQVY